MKIPVLLPNIFDHPFTYESDKKVEVGAYVEVPFGKTDAIGVVWDQFDICVMDASRASAWSNI